MDKKVKKYSRQDLINLFRKGSLPSHENFEQLINSNYNKADDRLDITDELGVQMYPVKTGKLLNFYEDPDDENPEYEISISKDGLFIQRAFDQVEKDKDDEKNPELFIQKSTGNISLGHIEPQTKLDVNGIITSQGRLGNYKEKEGGLNEIKADGYWHNVFETNLTGVHAFELIAYAKGKEKEGKYSILQAIVTCAYGKGSARVTKTRSQLTWQDKIDIRVVSKPLLIEKGNKTENEKNGFFKNFLLWFKILVNKRRLEYNLQLRTNRYFGDEKIYYKLMLLWGPNTISSTNKKANVKSGFKKYQEEIQTLIAKEEKQKAANAYLNTKLKNSNFNLDGLKSELELDADRNNKALDYLKELKILNNSLVKLSQNEVDENIENNKVFNTLRIEKLESLEKRIENALEQFKKNAKSDK
tara:strand:+ start:1042 stop:2286 length:1245 start_codon:yes stop_codon:yes gene_type:complete